MLCLFATVQDNLKPRGDKIEFKEAIGAIIAGVVLVIPAIKWLISDWAKKAEELERLRSRNTGSALNRLKDEVNSFKATVTNMQESVRALNASLVQNKADIALLKERLEDVRKMIERYEKTSDEKVRNIIKSEVQNLTQKIMLIRNKKINS